MANAVDALIYASISNSIKTTAQGIDSIVNYAGSQLSSINVLPTLDTVISNTTLKRACCLGSKSVAVRIPLPKEITFDVVTDKSTVLKKFNYYDKIVTIPPQLCPAQYDRFKSPNDTTVVNNCDLFFKTYCTNSLNDYDTNNTALGGTFNTNEFILFKPECACFVPPKYYNLEGRGVNVIPKCFYPGCSTGQFNAGQIWLDQASRGVGDCNVVLCNSTTIFDNLLAGNNININNKVIQECGVTGSTSPPIGSPIITPPSGTSTTTTPIITPPSGTPIPITTSPSVTPITTPPSGTPTTPITTPPSVTPTTSADTPTNQISSYISNNIIIIGGISVGLLILCIFFVMMLFFI